MTDKIIYPTDNGVGQYELDQCYRCGGAMEVVQYRGPYTWYRNGKPSLTLKVSSVPYVRCRECGTTLHTDATDEMLMWFYDRHHKESQPMSGADQPQNTQPPTDSTCVGIQCSAEPLMAALRSAIRALNVAPRFSVGDTDSYAIASECEAALAQAFAGSTAPATEVGLEERDAD